MKKHFLLLLWMTLLPLAGWSANIAVQLSTSLEKVYGSADPGTLKPTQFVIISDGGTGVHESDIAEYLTFKRKQGNTSESVGTYDWEVSVSPSYTANTIVVTNTGRISITPLNLSNVSSENLSADLTGSPFTYDGNAKEPTVTNVTAAGSNLNPSDYTISYEDNVDAGTAKVIITAASGNVTGSNFITFPIAKRTLAQNDLTIDDIPSVPFNASYWKPELNIKYGEVALEKGTDYTVAYTNNSNPGTATATVTLKGNYQNDGDIAKNFTITKYDLSNDADYASKIQVTGYSGLVYDGKAKTPAVTVKLNGVSYGNAYVSRSWDNNINATTENSKATLTLTGAAGAFKGTKVIDVEIAPKNLETVTIADIADQTYDGEAKKPELTVSFDNGEVVTLKEGEDYTVSYENNTNAGTTAKATITAVEGEGKNYTGSATKEFTISPVTVYIKPVAQSKFYGQADPNFAQPTTAMYELVDGEGNKVEGAKLNGTVVLGRKAGETVGDYPIYVKSYTVNPEVADNYSPSNASYYTNDENLGSHTAIFTIKTQEAKLILKFKEGTPATKVYGETTYAYSVDDLEVVSGLAGSDTWETLKGRAAFTPTLESEDVHHDGNKVTATITGLTNYPNIEVQPLAFTVTKRPIGIKPIDQNIDYGKAINQGGGYWVKAAGSSFAFTEVKKDVLVELYTDEDVATFAPGSEHVGAIKARIADESNYELDLENSAWGTLTVNAATQITLDRDDIDLATSITAFDGKNVVVKFANMTMKAKEWYAIVLPFATSPAELVKALKQYAVFNVLDTKNSTDQNFKFTLEMDELPAGVPFLIKPAQNLDWADFDLGTISSESVKKTIVSGIIDAVAEYESKELVRLTGSYTSQHLQGLKNDNGGEKVWWLADSGYKGDNNWKKPKTNPRDTKPMEAYLIGGEGWTTYSPSFTVEDIDDNGTTSIKTIGADEIHGLKVVEGWYNLNGVKLQGAPTQKGVYINNGKKVVIR